MGSYAFLSIGGYPIHSSRHYYGRWVFETADRCRVRRAKSERNTLIWAPPEPYEYDEHESEYLYVLSGTELSRRLERRGFDRATLEREFHACIGTRIARLEALCERGIEGGEGLRARCALYSSTSLSAWLDALGAAIDARLTAWRWKEVKAHYGDPLLHALFAFDEPIDERPIHDTAFPCATLESMAVALLAILPRDTQCVLDASNLVNSGWTDDFADLALDGDVMSFHARFAQTVADLPALLSDASSRSGSAGAYEANVLRAFAEYLATTFKKAVLTRPGTRLRFVNANETLRRKNLSLAGDTGSPMQLVGAVADAVDAMRFDDPEHVARLYADILDVTFSVETMTDLRRAFGWYRVYIDRARSTDGWRAGEATLGGFATPGELLEFVEATAHSIERQISSK